MTQNDPAGARRIRYLDSLRGIASLAVAVLWHYQHFSGLHQPGGPGVAEAPYYPVLPLKWGYKYGFVAVDLFFILSGFVFSYVYSEALAGRQMDAKTFFRLRFSRLYPLHLLTLIAVAFLAILFQSQYSYAPVYGLCDMYHFILNLLFLQKGFFDDGYSFNGPSWSLSVEAFLYLLFFLFASRGFGNRVPAACIVVSLFLLGTKAHFRFLLNEEIARGLGGFFVGVFLYKALYTHNWKLLLLPLMLVAMVMAVFFGVQHPGMKELPGQWFYPLSWIGFCCFILLLHHVHPLRTCLEIKPLVTLGDISLAMYLLHVPLQIAMLLALKYMHIAIPYHALWFLLLYAALLVSGSLLVYSFFEMPAQRWLRKNPLPVRRRPALTVAAEY